MTIGQWHEKYKVTGTRLREPLTTGKILFVDAVAKVVWNTADDSPSYFTSSHLAQLCYTLVTVESRMWCTDDIWTIFQWT